MAVDTWGGKGELALYGATRAKEFDKRKFNSSFIKIFKC